MTRSTLKVWVGFFMFLSLLLKKKLWSEENIYLNKLCNVKVLSSHAFCMIFLSEVHGAVEHDGLKLSRSYDFAHL